MKLFSRVLTLTGPPADSYAWATSMRNAVSEMIGRDVALWNIGFGAPIGSVAFTMRVEGLADLQSATATLIESPDYHAMLAGGRDFVIGPPNDGLSTPIHGDFGQDAPPMGAVAAITTATMSAGRYADAIAWGVKISQIVEQATGTPVVFAVDDFGTFGAVRWVGGSADMAGADASSAALASSAEYMAALDEAGGLFQEGSGQRGMATRIA
jgi:hypothetical protein